MFLFCGLSSLSCLLLLCSIYSNLVENSLSNNALSYCLLVFMNTSSFGDIFDNLIAMALGSFFIMFDG